MLAKSCSSEQKNNKEKYGITTWWYQSDPWSLITVLIAPIKSHLITHLAQVGSGVFQKALFQNLIHVFSVTNQLVFCSSFFAEEVCFLKDGFSIQLWEDTVSVLRQREVFDLTQCRNSWFSNVYLWYAHVGFHILVLTHLYNSFKYKDVVALFTDEESKALVHYVNCRGCLYESQRMSAQLPSP